MYESVDILSALFFITRRNEKKISNKQYIKIQQQLGSKIDN